MPVPWLLLLLVVGGMVEAGDERSRRLRNVNVPEQRLHAELQVGAVERGATEISAPTLEERRVGDADVDYHDPGPRYRFEYGVQDETTGDYKSHYEQRDGDYVQVRGDAIVSVVEFGTGVDDRPEFSSNAEGGHYEVLEPDGRTLRSVHYSTAGTNGGFVATVVRTDTESQDATSDLVRHSTESEGKLSTERGNHQGQRLTHAKNEMHHGYGRDAKTAWDDGDGNGNGYDDERQNQRDERTVHNGSSDESGNTIYSKAIGSNGRDVTSIRNDDTKHTNDSNPTDHVGRETVKSLSYDGDFSGQTSGEEANYRKPHIHGKTTERANNVRGVKKHRYRSYQAGKYTESYGYGGGEYGQPETDEEQIHHDERKQEEYNEKYNGDLKSLNNQNYNSERNHYGDGGDSGDIKYYDDEDYWVKSPPYDHDENDGSFKNGEGASHYSGDKEFTETRPHYGHGERLDNSKATNHYSNNNEFREKRPHYDHYESDGSSENGKTTSHYSDNNEFRETRPHYDHYESDDGSENGKATSHYSDNNEFRETRPHYGHGERLDNSKATNYYSDNNEFRETRPHYDHYESDGSSENGKTTSHYSDNNVFRETRPHNDHYDSDGSSENGKTTSHYSDNNEFRETRHHYKNNESLKRGEELRGPISHREEQKQIERYNGNYHKSFNGQNYNGASYQENYFREKPIRSSELTRHHDDNAVKPVKEDVEELELELESGSPTNLKKAQAPHSSDRTRMGRGRVNRFGHATSYLNYAKTRYSDRDRENLIAVLYSKPKNYTTPVENYRLSDPKMKLGKRESRNQNRSKTVDKEIPAGRSAASYSTSY